MKQKHGAFFALVMAAIFTLAGCGGSDSDPVWLADLSNPFLGQWESNIPSMDYAKLVSEYKGDGTFTCDFPEHPEFGGPFTGGYTVSGDILVGWLDFEGASAYKFKVVNNDTIDVTEINEVKEGGELVLGNTAPFTRVAGSPVNKEDKALVLSNAFIGKWGASIPNPDDPAHPYETLQEYRRDGTAQFILLPDYVFPVSYYFVTGDVLVIFDPSSNEYESFTFMVNTDGTLTVQELLGIKPDGSRELGVSSVFNPQQ
jgi:hypothetical protein